MLARIAALLRQAEDTDFVANTVRRGRADVEHRGEMVRSQT
jgi:hypothetical protein